MKCLLALTGLLVFASAAMAVPSPYSAPRLSQPADESALYLGPVGALVEADYFRVPEPTYGTTRIFPCRLRLHIAERDHHVVQSCE